MAPLPPDGQLQLRLRVLSAGLQDQGVTMLHHDTDQVIDLAENLPAIWPTVPAVGSTALTLLPAAIGAAYTGRLELTRASGTPQSLEFSLPDGLRSIEFRAQFYPDPDGTTVILTDITEERSRDSAVAALLREVSHRSKNLLAIVQSVAMQTAKHSRNTHDFVGKFTGRLHALSSTQDLVTESDWRGTYLQSLITAQLSRVGTLSLANVRITGENPILGPNAALHVGLAVHELSTNAAIYGALSHDHSGQIWVDAHYEAANDSGPELVIEWQETGLHLPQGAQAPRFGTMMLERIVPLSVGGHSTFTVTPDRVAYRLEIPGDQFEP